MICLLAVLFVTFFIVVGGTAGWVRGRGQYESYKYYRNRNRRRW